MVAKSFSVSQSYGGRYWTLRQPDEATVRALLPQIGGNDLLARLLEPRDVAPTDVETFLNPTLRALFPDPASFQDMMKAAELTLDAILDGRSVTVFADYDVDGGTSSAILARYFRAWGQEIGLYVPDRLTEGYGPSPEAFRHLKEQGADLVITVDCGAAAIAALAEAVAIDLPVIVIDHHLMGAEPPECAALVNPNRADDTSGQGPSCCRGCGLCFCGGAEQAGSGARHRASGRIARHSELARSLRIGDALRYVASARRKPGIRDTRSQDP